MIHFICQNSGTVWVSAETVQASVEKIGEIVGRNYDYFDVSGYDRHNGVEANRRWYFEIYESNGEFAADDADKLSKAGKFVGYVALVEREKLE